MVQIKINDKAKGLICIGKLISVVKRSDKNELSLSC